MLKQEQRVINITADQLFNDWRTNYHSLTYQQQQNFYDLVLTIWNDQQSFTLENVFTFFRFIPFNEIYSILELGGWKGELAAHILSFCRHYSYYVNLWDNFEITPLAIEQKLCKDKRYNCFVLDDFFWNVPINEKKEYNVFICSHTIEHLTSWDLEKLFNSLPKTIRWIYLEAPINESDTARSWHDYLGSHILEIGWEQIDNLLTNKGFKLVTRIANSCWYEK